MRGKKLFALVIAIAMVATVLFAMPFSVSAADLTADTVVGRFTANTQGSNSKDIFTEIKLGQLSSKEYRTFEMVVPEASYMWEGSDRTNMELTFYTEGLIGLYVNNMKVVDKDGNILKEFKGESFGMDVQGASLRTNLVDFIEYIEEEGARFCNPGKSGLFIWGGDTPAVKDVADAKQYKVIVSVKSEPWDGEDTAEPTTAPTSAPTDEPKTPSTPATSDASVLMTLVIAGAAAFGGLKLRRK